MKVVNNFDIEIYRIFDSSTPYLVGWISIFFVITISKIFRIIFTGKSFRHTGLKSELPGIPLTLMHTYVWYLSILKKDLVTCLLFSWWGPGFLVSAYLVLFRKDFNWPKFGKLTAYLCKIHYVIYMGIFYYFETYSLIFVFSVWIIQDQICLIWFEKNADRSRRLLEDKWIFRILYPMCLFTPYLFKMNFQFEYQILGVSLFVVWAYSVVKIVADGDFYKRPHSYKEFLRNIVYEKK